MFIGHYAVGFAAKRFAPKASLGWLMAAPAFVDLIWPLFLLAGWEHVRIDPGNTKFTPLDFYDYPWTHSLLMGAVWATLLAGLYLIITRYKPGAVAIWIGVVSHWVLDLIVHRPDLPLYPGGPKFGLGLWNSVAGTVAVESIMFAAGVYLYAKATRAKDKIGRYGFWSFVAFLVLIYVADINSPPPPNERVLAIVALAGWIVVPWTCWFDRHREAISPGKEQRV
jgi:hypothetical protein